MKIDLNGAHLSSSGTVKFTETNNGVISFEFEKNTEINCIHIVCKNNTQDFTISLQEEGAKAFNKILECYIEELK